MKKVVLPLLIMIVLLSGVLAPVPGEASRLDELTKELEKLNAEEKRVKTQLADNKKEIEQTIKEQKQAEKEINYLLEQIDNKNSEISKKETEISETEDSLLQKAAELDEAEERVAARDALLKSRLKIMYTNGFSTYLDVLFNSTSFSDFLDRYQSLSLIVDQDKDILASNIEDKNLVALRKSEIESDLAHLKNLYEELRTEKEELVIKERDKEVLIASLQVKKESLEEITEEQEQALNDQIRKKSALARELNQLRAAMSGKFSYPLPKEYRITSPFGMRVHPVNKTKKMHNGIDLGAPSGTDVLAAGEGVVIIAGWWGGYGNTVVIDHLNGFWTLYAHMSKISVKDGDDIKTGKKVGEVGNTGVSTGAHLHYEVRKDEQPVDPKKHTAGF